MAATAPNPPLPPARTADPALLIYEAKPPKVGPDGRAPLWAAEPPAVKFEPLGMPTAPVARPASAAGWLDLGFSIPRGDACYLSEHDAGAPAVSERECYERAVSLEPGSARAWFLLGQELAWSEREMRRAADVAKYAARTARYAAGDFTDDAEDDDETTAKGLEVHVAAAVVYRGTDEERTVYADVCFAKAAELLLELLAQMGARSNERTQECLDTCDWLIATCSQLHRYLEINQRSVKLQEQRLGDYELFVLAARFAYMRDTRVMKYAAVARAFACRMLAMFERQLTIDGEYVYDGFEMWEQALSSRAYFHCADTWSRAAEYLTCFPDDATFTVRGAQYTKHACIVRSIELENIPGRELKKLSFAVRMWPFGGAINVNGVEWTEVALVQRLVESAPSCDHWCSLTTALATLIHDGTMPTATIHGKTYTLVDALNAAIEADPMSPEPFSIASRMCRRGATVPLQGRAMNELDLAFESIRRDPNDWAAWYAASVAMQTRSLPDTMEYDGKTYTLIDAAIKAVELNPENHEAIRHLASCLVPGRPYEVNGVVVTKLGLLQGMVMHAPNEATSWRQLGNAVLFHDPHLSLSIAGDEYTAKDMFVAALARDVNSAPGWLGLLRASGTEDPVQVNVLQVYTRRELLGNAFAEGDGKNMRVWLELAFSLQRSSGSAAREERRSALLSACQHADEGDEPEVAQALLALADDLEEGETITVRLPRDKVELRASLDVDPFLPVEDTALGTTTLEDQTKLQLLVRAVEYASRYDAAIRFRAFKTRRTALEKLAAVVDASADPEVQLLGRSWTASELLVEAHAPFQDDVTY